MIFFKICDTIAIWNALQHWTLHVNFCTYTSSCYAIWTDEIRVQLVFN